MATHSLHAKTMRRRLFALSASGDSLAHAALPRRVRVLLGCVVSGVLALCAAGCDGDPPPPPATSPQASAPAAAASAAAPLARAEAEEVDPAEVLGGGAVVAEEEPSDWLACRPAPLARVRRSRVAGVVPEVTVGDRIEEGWATRPVDQLGANGEEVASGSWACRRAEDGMLEVAYLSAVHAMRVGPVFGFDATNDTVVPRNWLATVVLSEDPNVESAQRRPLAESLASLAACRTPSGTPMSTGLFIYLENLERFGGAGSPLGWLVIPNVVNDGEDFRDEVGFQRATNNGPQAITFEVARDGCRPVGAAAERVMQFAAGVRRDDMQGLDRSVPTSASGSEGTRAALEFTFGSDRLAILDDWVTFHATNRPYQSGGWQAVGPKSDGSYDVGHQFTLGSDEYLLAWTANTRLRTLTPLSPLADMAARSTPVLAPVARTIAPAPQVVNAAAPAPVGDETLSPEVISQRISASEGDISRCYEREERFGRGPQAVSASWQVNPDGSASDVTLTVTGDASRRFERCVRGAITSARYPAFDGSPISARTEFTFSRE